LTRQSSRRPEGIEPWSQTDLDLQACLESLPADARRPGARRANAVRCAVQLGELLGALSLATDLAAGLPLEASLRTCVLATRTARLAGVAEIDEVRRATLLRHLGCTAFAHEAARLGGDDHDLLTAYAGVDSASRSAVVGRTVT